MKTMILTLAAVLGSRHQPRGAGCAVAAVSAGTERQWLIIN
jgi:hypothetical protein